MYGLLAFIDLIMPMIKFNGSRCFRFSSVVALDRVWMSTRAARYRQYGSHDPAWILVREAGLQQEPKIRTLARVSVSTRRRMTLIVSTASKHLFLLSASSKSLCGEVLARKMAAWWRQIVLAWMLMWSITALGLSKLDWILRCGGRRRRISRIAPSSSAWRSQKALSEFSWVPLRRSLRWR